MATGTVKPPPADLRRPRGREALATHPPAPVDDTTSWSLEKRAERTSRARDPRPTSNRRPQQDRDLGLEQGRDRAPAPRCRHTAHPRPPIEAFSDEYATVDDLAAVRLDADPDATGPHSQVLCCGTPSEHRGKETASWLRLTRSWTGRAALMPPLTATFLGDRTSTWCACSTVLGSSTATPETKRYERLDA